MFDSDADQKEMITRLQAGLKLAGAVLLTAVVFILALYYAPPALSNNLEPLLASWLTLFLTHLPLLILGALTAGLMSVFLPRQAVRPLLPRRWLVAFVPTAVLGFIIPFGLFGNIPIARQLQQNGLPSSLTVVFLLSSAVLNPLSLLASWNAIGAELTLGRVGLALLIALMAGLVFARVERTHAVSLTPSRYFSLPLPVASSRLTRLWAGLARGGDELLEFGAYFVVGSLLTAVVSVWLAPFNLLHTAVGITLLGFLSPPEPFFISDTAVWLTRALPLPVALAYLTSNSLLPLTAALLHTRLWHLRWWLLLLLITLTPPLLLALIGRM